MMWLIFLLTISALTSTTSQQNVGLNQQQLLAYQQQHLAAINQKHLLGLNLQQPNVGLPQKHVLGPGIQQPNIGLVQLKKQQFLQQQLLQQLVAKDPKGMMGQPQKMYTKSIQLNKRHQKPNVNPPNAFNGGNWKLPNNFLNPTMKDVYRNPGIQATASQPYPYYIPTSQNLLAAQSQQHKLLSPQQYKPLGLQLNKNSLFNATPPKNLFVPQQNFNKNYQTINKQLQNQQLQNQQLQNQLLQNQQTPKKHTHPFQSVFSNLPKINTQLQNSIPLFTPAKNIASNFIGLNLISSTPSPTYTNLVGQPQIPQQAFLPENAVSHINTLVYQPTLPPSQIVYPMKTVGDGGPIHTIPAPNLGPADKSLAGNSYLNTLSALYKDNSHSYEVTEPTQDKTYVDQFTGITKLYAPDPNAQKVNSFSSVIKSPSPYRTSSNVQPGAQSLTSQELYKIMNSVPSQQQLSDTYNIPLLQQPQLQQHFLQKTLDGYSQLQPFNAVIQPFYGDDKTNIQQNVLFKPDPKYLQKVQEQFIKPTSVLNPTSQSYNYLNNNYRENNLESIADKIKSEIDAYIQNDQSTGVHFNRVRSTNEGVASENKFVFNSTQQLEQTPSDSFNIETKVKFIPNEELKGETKSYSKSIKDGNSYLTQVNDANSKSTNYYQYFSNEDMINRLATLQAAGNIMGDKTQDASINQYGYNDLNPYFVQNTLPGDEKYQYIQSNNNAFTPIKSSTLTVSPDTDGVESHAPIRIYVPDQYEDIEIQPSENIAISASINTKESDIPSAEHNENGVSDQKENRSDYEDYAQFQITEVEGPKISADSNIKATENEPQSDNLIVTLQKNETNPSVDIFTKDWKTSIVIQQNDDIDNGSSSTNEFGNRLRPKREENN